MKTYTKAVSAALASALAVGMVPAMALADDAAIELQGTASIKEDVGDGGYISEFAGDLTAGHKFTYNTKAQVLTPEFAVGGLSGVTYEVVEYKYYPVAATGADMKLDEDTTVKVGAEITDPTTIVNVGKYVVQAYVKGTSNQPVEYCAMFEIVGQGLEGAQVVEFDDSDVDDIADAGIVYDGTPKDFSYTVADGELGIVVDGEILTGYTVDAIYNANNVKVYPSSVPMVAGDYTIAITANDDAHKGQKIELPYTIQKYDLSTAVLNDVIWETGTQPTAAHITVGGGLAESDLVVSHSATATNGHKVMTVALNAATASVEEKASVTGTAALEYDIVTDDVSSDLVIKYNDGAAGDMTVGAVKPKSNFSIASVGATVDGKDLEDGQFELVVKNLGTNKFVDPSVLEDESVQGTFEVRVKVVPSKVNYAFGGISTTSFQVTVDNGTVKVADTAFIYDGAVLKNDKMTVDYSGEDFAAKLSVAVETDEGDKLVEGTDYTVEITKNGKVVTEAIDKGEYTFKIKSTKYEIGGSVSFKLTVDDAEVFAEIVDEIGIAPVAIPGQWASDSADIIEDGTVFYTGKEIDPVVKFWTVDEAAKKAADKWVEMDVPASAYKVVIDEFFAEDQEEQPAKTPTAIKQAGWYRLSIVDLKNGTEADNYEVEGVCDVEADTTDTSFVLYVTSENVFTDVKAGAWYAPSVYAVADAGIMGGYGNGKFGTNDTAERQDLAVTMFRLLNPSERLTGSEDSDNSADHILLPEYSLPFSDTNGKAYYAEAVWYCNKNGIMTGYSNSDEFGVGDTVTREQVATVLYRSSDIYGKTTLLAGALDAYVDADEISNYAVEAMEWAVEEGIFGVNTKFLNPTDPITRAELAAVIARYM